MTNSMENTMTGLRTIISSGVTDPAGRSKQWVYPDRPRLTLSTENFPRISITHIGEGFDYRGIGSITHRKRISYDVGVWVKEKPMYWVASAAYNGTKLVSYLLDQIVDNVLEDTTSVNYLVSNYGVNEVHLIGRRASEYNDQRKLFKGTLTIEVEVDE